MDVRDRSADVGTAANPPVNPPRLLLAVADVVEAIAPDLQLGVRETVVDLHGTDPLSVVTGVLVPGVSHDTHLGLEQHPPKGTVALADGVVGAGRGCRREHGCQGESGRSHSTTEDGSQPALSVAQYHFRHSIYRWLTMRGFRRKGSTTLRTASYLETRSK